MKYAKRIILFPLLSIILIISITTASQAVETEVDVGIEFTEITDQPKPKPDIKPPIKKKYVLPQTGEKTNLILGILGLITVSSVSLVIYQRQSEVAKK